MTVAAAAAPVPSTRRLPEVSEVLLTLMTPAAYDGAASTAAVIESVVATTTQTLTRSRCLLVIGAPSSTADVGTARTPAARGLASGAGNGR